jgi:hypothetical protein
VQRHIYQCRVLVHHHDVDFSGHVTVGVNFQFVHSRHQNPPELSVLGRLEAHVSGLHLEGSLLNRITVLVHDETVNAPVCFGEEFDQRLKLICHGKIAQFRGFVPCGCPPNTWGVRGREDIYSKRLPE